MRWRFILILSACVNVALLATVWHYARKASSLAAEPANLGTNSNVKYRTQVVVRRQFFTWDEVESTDYATYVANLRDIGCPEQTIRDIIIADVNALFVRRRENEIQSIAQQWWHSSSDASVIRAAAKKLGELETERRTLLTRLLGPDWDPTATLAAATNRQPGLTLDGPVLGVLPDDIKSSVNSIVAASQLRMDALLAKAAQEGRNPTAAELADIREQTRVELQNILSPGQLEEFLLRYSQNATELRSELGDLRYFNASPEEFRALFRARNQFDQKIAALAGSTNPNDISLRQSLEQQRENAIRLALGAKRYELFNLLQNPDYRTAYSQALAVGDPGAARTVYDINQATAAELARVSADPSLADPQLAIQAKRIELEQLKATAEAYGMEIPRDPNAPPPPPPPPQNRAHVIRSGDTLGALSTAYGVPVNAIIDANPGLQINSLKSGQRIIIPPVRRQAPQ